MTGHVAPESPVTFLRNQRSRCSGIPPDEGVAGDPHLPHALNGLVARHPRRLYKLLFRAVSDTLLEFVAKPRHLVGTRRSRLSRIPGPNKWLHPHLRVLRAGEALNKCGAWVNPRHGFLLPGKALSAVFRGKFVAALRQERDGRLTPRSVPQGGARCIGMTG